MSYDPFGTAQPQQQQPVRDGPTTYTPFGFMPAPHQRAHIEENDNRLQQLYYAIVEIAADFPFGYYNPLVGASYGSFVHAIMNEHIKLLQQLSTAQ